jgi:hypothetical protein
LTDYRSGDSEKMGARMRRDVDPDITRMVLMSDNPPLVLLALNLRAGGQRVEWATLKAGWMLVTAGAGLAMDKEGTATDQRWRGVSG